MLPAAGVTGDSEQDAGASVVRPASTRAERVAALTLLFADTSTPADLPADVERVAALADAGELSLAGLLVAANGEGVRGATLVTPGPGGSADLLAPRFSAGARSSVREALLAAAGAFAAAAGCERLQGFLDPVRTDDAFLLTSNGFRCAADLRLLRRDCVTPLTLSVSRVDSPLSLTPETERLFREAVRASYADSRDAPDARGADADADFAAHLASSGFRPDLCRLSTVGSGAGAGATGVALIAASGAGAGAEWDICYLGVAASARRRGLGRALLADRLAAARDAGAAAVTCAVDAANEPARRLYAAAGFTETASRTLFLRPLEPHSPLRPAEAGSAG